MYGLPINYNPFGPHVQQPLPPLNVSPKQSRAARNAGAISISPDGKRAYRDDRGDPEVAYWDGQMFPSWWPCPGGIPGNVARLE